MKSVCRVLLLMLVVLGLANPVIAQQSVTVIIDDWQNGLNLHLLGDEDWVRPSAINWDGLTRMGLSAFNEGHRTSWSKDFALDRRAAGDGVLLFGVYDSAYGNGYADSVYWDGELLGFLPNYSNQGSGPVSFNIAREKLQTGTHSLAVQSSFAQSNWDDFVFFDMSVTYPVPEPSSLLMLLSGFGGFCWRRLTRRPCYRQVCYGGSNPAKR